MSNPAKPTPNQAKPLENISYTWDKPMKKKDKPNQKQAKKIENIA